jgi:hypothetical protein
VAFRPPPSPSPSSFFPSPSFLASSSKASIKALINFLPPSSLVPLWPSSPGRSVLKASQKEGPGGTREDEEGPRRTRRDKKGQMDEGGRGKGQEEEGKGQAARREGWEGGRRRSKRNIQNSGLSKQLRIFAHNCQNFGFFSVNRSFRRTRELGRQKYFLSQFFCKGQGLQNRNF